MHALLFAALLSGDVNSCAFVQLWASRALYAIEAGLPEEKWHILAEGFTPEEYTAIVEIRTEAYHNQRALKHRIRTACAQKEST